MKLKDLMESLEALHALFGDVPVKFAALRQDFEAVSAYGSDDEREVWVDLVSTGTEEGR